MQIKDNVVVITGGASGLGAGCAAHLGGLGAKLVLFDLDRQAGEEKAKKLGAQFVHTDVCDDNSVKAALSEAGRSGPLRVIINCAGILDAGITARRDKKTGKATVFPSARFARMMEVNLVGTYRVMAHAAALMLDNPPLEEGERGVVINTSSVAAEDGQIGQIAYAASKGGVKSMSLPAARDLARVGVRVNAILPGVFETPMVGGMPDKLRESLEAAIPFPARLGTASEYASLVAEIIRNRYINGAAIRLDAAVRLAPR